MAKPTGRLRLSDPVHKASRTVSGTVTRIGLWLRVLLRDEGLGIYADFETYLIYKRLGEPA